MTETIGAFGFAIYGGGKPKPDELPTNPIVILMLNHWTTSKGGVPEVSPHLMTDGEIDRYVNALKSDLDTVGKRAKAALKKAMERN